MHRPLLVATSLLVAFAATTARAADVPVADVDALLQAIAAAQPGDTIVLAAGDYEVHQSKIACETPGTADAPITVRAAEPGAAKLRFDALEGFHVRAPWWVFEGLDIEGICAADSDCEHAFHVTGDASNTHIVRNRLHGFNAMIKGNGEPIGPGMSYVHPDDVVVEYNEFFNPAPRDTSNPVTPIDVVGGQRWIVRGNFIHDHAKGGGDNISYAAFLKGHSKDGLIERNLVVCELLHSGQVRLGLSLGGGGSGPDMICEDGACKPEHERGIVRNNIVLNCPADVGIYVNAGADSKIFNNTLYNTAGIDMRFAETTGVVHNNLLMGKIRDRDGAVTDKQNNLAEATLEQFAAWFADPAAQDFTLVDGAAFVDLGLAAPDVTDDYCGNLRDDGTPDIGAIEYDGDGCNGGLPAETSGGEPSTTGDPTGGDTTTGDPTGDPSTGDLPTSGASDGPTTGSPSTATDGGPTTDGTTGAATDPGSATAGDTSPEQDDDGGCGCRSGSPLGGPLALLALAAIRRRRPRRA
ncbi:right-handed parallel beta-helix repeat-containing protein [Nannocystis sp. SCPEA4]|uniref:right-handed parallel beta-helix repeat-containing protein n=1 Tax=Nannocystis sp. SCPEA4 TaxID=2996787 RepID=UPI00226D8C87|nr:right-handed parallel beta-helix repeat-containing protein [Nannocystis sp. SCPEA4]MCY1060164.1 right-handed parallel beta-helix repeat-containing protein [Nannocystis sp. SCPEA4]